ncbi:MAG: hypothetical protein Q8S13_06430 [Dehalococcoidia bacterium]|nr:hypothetical protein [Dehalococcoidia bacterium]
MSAIVAGSALERFAASLGSSTAKQRPLEELSLEELELRVLLNEHRARVAKRAGFLAGFTGGALGAGKFLK